MSIWVQLIKQTFQWSPARLQCIKGSLHKVNPQFSSTPKISPQTPNDSSTKQTSSKPLYGPFYFTWVQDGMNTNIYHPIKSPGFSVARAEAKTPFSKVIPTASPASLRKGSSERLASPLFFKDFWVHLNQNINATLFWVLLGASIHWLETWTISELWQKNTKLRTTGSRLLVAQKLEEGLLGFTMKQGRPTIDIVQIELTLIKRSHQSCIELFVYVIFSPEPIEL